MNPISDHTATLLGMGAGMSHGISMAIRKHYGNGDTTYWKMPQWWIGVLLDFAGGTAFGIASPFLNSAILLAVIVCAQMSASFMIGVLCFGEKAKVTGILGLVSTLIGNVALAFCKHEPTTLISPAEFWAQWLAPSFLKMNLAWLALILLLIRLSRVPNADPSMTALTYTVVAAYAEGVEFLPSRCLASVVTTSGSFSELVLGTVVVKVLCMLVYAHFQQLALTFDLHVIGSLYPGITSLICGTLAATVFGDPTPLNGPLCIALIATMGGIGLHAVPQQRESPDSCKVSLLPNGDVNEPLLGA